MIKQPYYNIFLQLRDWILKEINNTLNQLPKTIPCKVLTNNGQTVNVIPILNLNTNPKQINNIPIAKSRYFNLPFQSGDLGLLVPSDYLYNDLILTNLGFISGPKKSTNLSGYIFVPFTNYAQDYAGVNVNNNTKLFSQNGAADIEITNTDIKLKTNEEILWSKLKTFLDTWQTNYNANIVQENLNLASINTQLTTLGHPATIVPLTQFNGTYR